MFWLHNNEIINKTSFGSLLNTAALYLLYFFLSQALVKIAFTPFNSKWRIIEVNDARAQSISSALIFSAAAVCIVSFFQSLSGQMNNTETIYALKIFANAVKAFCVILVANKFLYDNDLQNKNADAALEEIPASAQNNADEDPGELSVGAKISLAITFFMSIAFAASLFGYIRLSEFAINRFIVSALIIALFYILYKLFRVFFRKLLSFRFWVKTFRINPRTLVKANFWFALILKPVLSLIALFFLLAAWGVSVDILLNKIKNFLIGFNIGSVHISITSILLGLLTFFVSLFLFRSLKKQLYQRQPQPDRHGRRRQKFAYLGNRLFRVYIFAHLRYCRNGRKLQQHRHYGRSFVLWCRSRSPKHRQQSGCRYDHPVRTPDKNR